MSKTEHKHITLDISLKGSGSMQVSESELQQLQ